MSIKDKPFSAPGGGDSDKSPSSSFADAISAFRDIESLLGGESDSIDLPLREMLKLMPADYVTVTNPEEAPDIKVPVKMDDVFYQLSKGKVTLSAAQLAASLPPEFIRPQALDDDHMTIKLPLPLVVAAIDPQMLKDRTAIKTSRHKAMDMPDPFARKKQAPAPASATPAEVSATPPPPAPVAPVKQVTPPPPVVQAPPPPPVIQTPPPPPVVQAPPPPPVVEEPEPVSLPEELPVETLPESAAVSSTEPVEIAPPQDELETLPVSEAVEVQEPVVTSDEPAVTAEEPAAFQAVAPAEEPPAPEMPAIPAPKPTPVAAVDRPKVRPPRPPAPAPEDEPSGIEEGDSFGGVNINTATDEQMLTLDGVTPAVAEAILAYRDQNGPFKSIFDIQDIPRVGRITFRKMTGMPYSKSRRHRRWKLAKLLGIRTNQVGNLPSVAQALADKSGFSGCVISDQDGLLLAERGAAQFAETLSAVTPKLMSLATENAKLLNLGDMDSVSLCIGSHMLTTVSCGKACLTAIHLRNKLTKGQLTLVRKIAAELGWLFSHRAYVGR